MIQTGKALTHETPYALHVVHILKPGEGQAMHSHAATEHSIVVLEGTVEVGTPEASREMQQGAEVWARKGQQHYFVAKTDAVVLSVTPNLEQFHRNYL